jgi:LDH2 family malate/lactate/ureidoglycolate dehydrogenase
LSNHTFSYAALQSFCREVFAGYGFQADDAAVISDVILRADLYGIESHGVARLVRYDEEIELGQVNVQAKAEIIHETPVSAVLDGHKAMGQLTSVTAMRIAIDKARKSGIGMVAVRNSNHYGIAGYYTMMAAESDLIGTSMTNTEAICVPTFGRRPMLGTNALAFAMPANPVPFSFDAATTVVPRGKLEVYRDHGETLPEGWALDSDGNASVDAETVINSIIHKTGGGIAPLGGSGESGAGYKGYGFAAMVEIATAILSGGLTSNHVNVTPGEAGMCHYFSAVDYGLFGNKEVIKKRLSAYLQELRDSPKAAGHDRIYTHGERSFETAARRLKEGIPIGAKTCENLRKLAAKMRLAFSDAESGT